MREDYNLASVLFLSALLTFSTTYYLPMPTWIGIAVIVTSIVMFSFGIGAIAEGYLVSEKPDEWSDWDNQLSHWWWDN